MKYLVLTTCLLILLIGAMALAYLYLEDQCADAGGVRLRGAFSQFDCYAKDSLKIVEPQ